MDETRTIRAQLAVATARLKSAQIEHPGREARHLLQFVCAFDAARLISEELNELDDALRTRFFDLVERRAAGEPFEYLTGEAHFYGLLLHCSPATLIPRADSEVVVDEALTRLPLDRPAMVADLGTGTACLLIAVMTNHPGLRGVGIERSDAASAVARQNIERHGLVGRAQILTGGWEAWGGWGQADLIISNPPYIVHDVIETLEPGVKAYEPHEALDGGTDGLDAYRSLISLAAEGMKPDAWLVLEIGFDQRETVSALLHEAGFNAISSVQDMGQNDRVVCAKR